MSGTWKAVIVAAVVVTWAAIAVFGTMYLRHRHKDLSRSREVPPEVTRH